MTYNDTSWWKRKPGLAGNCAPCLQGACQRWWGLNLYGGVSQPTEVMGTGRKTIREGFSRADSVLRKIVDPLSLSKNYLREYLNLFIRNLNRVPETSSQICSLFEIQQLLGSLLRITVFNVCVIVCIGAQGNEKMGIFPLQQTFPPPICYPHLKGVSLYWFLPPVKSLVNSCLVGQRH